jgi:ATP-binding cassette subfamily C (CFTR/MRP) protein 1
MQMLNLVNSALYNASPVLVALAAFTTFYLRGGTLTAKVAFPALALFNLMRFPIVMLPTQIMNMVAARVALQRLQKFMDAEEMEALPAPSPARASETGVGGRLLILLCVGCFVWVLCAGDAGKAPPFHHPCSSGPLVFGSKLHVIPYLWA